MVMKRFQKKKKMLAIRSGWELTESRGSCVLSAYNGGRPASWRPVLPAESRQRDWKVRMWKHRVLPKCLYMHVHVLTWGVQPLSWNRVRTQSCKGSRGQGWGKDWKEGKQCKSAAPSPLPCLFPGCWQPGVYVLSGRKTVFLYRKWIAPKERPKYTNVLPSPIKHSNLCNFLPKKWDSRCIGPMSHQIQMNGGNNPN